MRQHHIASVFETAVFHEGDDQVKEIYRIGDLAQEFGVTLRTLRFYEDRGLIKPERSGSTRLYSQADRSRLRIILLAKRIGFSLIEIQEIMDLHDNSSDERAQLKSIRDRFASQSAVLKAQQAELSQASEELNKAIQSLDTALADF